MNKYQTARNRNIKGIQNQFGFEYKIARIIDSFGYEAYTMTEQQLSEWVNILLISGEFMKRTKMSVKQLLKYLKAEIELIEYMMDYREIENSVELLGIMHRYYGECGMLEALEDGYLLIDSVIPDLLVKAEFEIVDIHNREIKFLKARYIKK